MNSKFIYGKDTRENVVNVSVRGNTAYIFQRVDGKIVETEEPASIYAIYNDDYLGSQTLAGNLEYKYVKLYNSTEERRREVRMAEESGRKAFVIYNPVEAHLIRTGITYFKNMAPENLNVLAFDIETTGLTHDIDSKVLLISNTLRCGSKIQRKLFKITDYESDADMIRDWCKWVTKMDPDVIVGHNILNFDLPYLSFCAGKDGLKIGRHGRSARFAQNPREFRKDGSQSYEYHDVTVFGREVIDTCFLSIKYDIGRKYESYGLKNIVAQEGLEVNGRQHYDASTIKDNYKNPDEWEKICAYAMYDADDALSLYDLMIPAFFYYTQSIPKAFQQIINTATGSQVNAFLLRAYLQEGHSIPEKSAPKHYEGAISFGNPGIYKNVYKVDVASLYPSIIMCYKIHNKSKDPKGYFLKMIEIFTEERLRNKSLAKQTGDRRYRDLEQAQKILINSGYGFLGAPGLTFNSPEHAELVTKYGREILQKAIQWAESKDYKIVNADTDSISFAPPKKLTADAFQKEIEELNGLYSDHIRWEDDGYYKTVVVLKAKNYVLYDGKHITIKGSALKATTKEPALKQFISESLERLVKGYKDELYDIYNYYAARIRDIEDGTDIKPWCFKKTVTKKILSPERTNESRVLDAVTRINKDIREGDKIYLFFEEEESLSLLEGFSGKISKKTLYNKLFKTIEIFSSVVDTELFPNYSLKRNEERVDAI